MRIRLRENTSYLLRGRAGVDVRACVSHVRKGYVKDSATAPLIVEPARGARRRWVDAVARHGPRAARTMHDGDIGLQLQRGGLGRDGSPHAPISAEPAAAMAPGVYNGWQGVEVEMPGARQGIRPSDPRSPVERSGTFYARARPGGRRG